MRLVYKFKNYQNNDELLRLCKISKDLYNQALYIVKTNLKKENRFTFYDKLDRTLKITPNLEGEINYRKLKAQVSQQCLKTLDKSIKGYAKSIKDWSKNKEKYKILIDNDCVTVCKKEDWEQDIDVDFVDFNEYGYYLLNEIFLALGLDSEFV